MLSRLGAFVLAVFCATGHVSAQSDSALVAITKDYQAIGWEAVGRLDLGGGFCTGTLISPTLVISAAHCLYGPGGKHRMPQHIVFHAGLRDGQVAASRRIVRMVAHRGFDPNAPLSRETVSHDVALLELEEPISLYEVNPFALHTDTVAPGSVSVVSYGRGRADYQSRQRNCTFMRKRENMLVFNCDVTFGSSGSPVFSHMNGRPRIMSVISGMSSNGDEQFSLGPHLPGLVSELKRELRGKQKVVLPVVPVMREQRNVFRDRPTKPADEGPTMRRISVGEGHQTGAKFVKARPRDGS